MVRLTELAHDLVRESLRPGDVAVDATAGNGYDTLFLCRQVGAEGRVYAFDVQAEALARTAERLRSEGWKNATLIQRSHAELRMALPPGIRQVGAVMFNLGYLPSGNRTVTTKAVTTVFALREALELIRAGGVVTVLAYTGHPGGAEEADLVSEVFHNLSESLFYLGGRCGPDDRVDSPRLFFVRKL
jgi:predicted methyltransferase